MGEQLTRSERWSEKPEDGGSTPLSPTSREIGRHFNFITKDPLWLQSLEFDSFCNRQRVAIWGRKGFDGALKD